MHFLEKLSQEFKKESTVLSVKSRSRMLSGKTWKKFKSCFTAQNTGIAPYFLVWNFCGKA